MYKLENWAVVYKDEYLYEAMELRTAYLTGNVYNHSKYEDGYSIITSAIISVHGNVVTTRHSTYELGEPREDYIEWCKANGHHIPTKEQPILMHETRPC